MERLYSIYQVADLLGATPAMIAEWMGKGQLPFDRTGDGAVRISSTNLVNFLKTRGIDIEQVLAGAAMGQNAGDQEVAEQEAAPAQAPAPEQNTALAAPAEPMAAQVADAILKDAVERRASEIHLEPIREGLALRFRIDGVLHDRVNFRMRLPRSLAPKLTAHFRALAGLNGPTDGPETGQFTTLVEGREVLFRLAGLATLHGRRVTIGVHDLQRPGLELGQLGLSGVQELSLRNSLAQPYGLVVVVGPPRSGRASTLAAMISAMDLRRRNILVVGRPELREIEGIGYCLPEGDPAGLLTAIGRQEPDVIVLEQLKQAPLAAAAVEQALAGRLVLASLTARSITEGLVALMELGAIPFALSSALLAVVNQRLVRRLCPQCRQAQAPAAGRLEQLGLRPGELDSAAFESKGCAKCSNSGYAGRTGVFEVMGVSETLARYVRAGLGARVVEAAAIEEGMTSLRQAALDKTRDGTTSLDEVGSILTSARR